MTPQQPIDRRLSRADWTLAGMALLSTWLVFASFRQDRDWNSTSRLLLSYALAERGTVSIAPYVAVNGQLLADPATRDLSSPRPGEFYCDKAPGHSFVGAIAAWTTGQWTQSPAYPEAAPVMKSWPLDWWTIVFTNGLLTAANSALVLLASRLTGAGRLASSLAAYSFAFATNALPYATVYYGHASAGFFVTTCLTCAFCGARSTAWRHCWGLLAGAAAGAAVVCEYPLAVLPVAVALALGVQCMLARTGRTQFFGLAGSFLCGGLPLAIFLGWYHQRVTGSPWMPPYKYEVEDVFAYHRAGAGIPIGAPNWAVILELLLGQRRGMLWFAPAALLGLLVTLIALADRRRSAFACASLLVFFGLLAVNAGFPTWDGGWSSGPRFLLPAFGPLCVAIAWLLSRPRRAVIPVWLKFARGACFLGWFAAFLVGVYFAIGSVVAGVAIPPHVQRPREFIVQAMNSNATNSILEINRRSAQRTQWKRGDIWAATALACGTAVLVAAIWARRLDRRDGGVDETR